MPSGIYPKEKRRKFLTKKHKERISEAHRGKHKPWAGKHKHGSLSPEWKLKIKEGSRKGNKNYLWKDNDASHSAIHSWLKRSFGKAVKCENPKCVYLRLDKNNKLMKHPKRYEWALIKGKKHTHRKSNYIMLCVSCHRKYDKNTNFKI